MNIKQKEYDAQLETLSKYYGTDKKTLINTLIHQCWMDTQKEMTDRQKENLNKLFMKFLNVEEI